MLIPTICFILLGVCQGFPGDRDWTTDLFENIRQINQNVQRQVQDINKDVQQRVQRVNQHVQDVQQRVNDMTRNLPEQIANFQVSGTGNFNTIQQCNGVSVISQSIMSPNGATYHQTTKTWSADNKNYQIESITNPQTRTSDFYGYYVDWNNSKFERHTLTPEEVENLWKSSPNC